MRHGPERYVLGEHGRASGEKTLVEVDVSALADDGRCRLDLVKCGETVASCAVAGPGKYPLTDPRTGPGWFRIELWAADSPLVISNHIELRA